jgi:hypothetical protein
MRKYFPSNKVKCSEKGHDKHQLVRIFLPCTTLVCNQKISSLYYSCMQLEKSLLLKVVRKHVSPTHC